MSNETLQPSVSQMLRMTGENTFEFMKHVAEHIDKLEAQIEALKVRVNELEGNANVSE